MRSTLIIVGCNILGLAILLGVILWLSRLPVFTGREQPPPVATVYKTTPTSKTSPETYNAHDLDQFLARIDAYLVRNK